MFSPRFFAKLPKSKFKYTFVISNLPKFKIGNKFPIGLNGPWGNGNVNKKTTNTEIFCLSKK